MKLRLIIPPAPRTRSFAIPISITQIKAFLENHGCLVSTIDLNILTRKNAQFFDHIFNKFDEDGVRSYLVSSEQNTYLRAMVQFFFRTIDLKDPSPVGFSITGYDELLTALVLAKALKAKCPDIKIILGGRFLTANQYVILDDFDFIDFVIWGAGEKGLLLLLKHLQARNNKLDHIPGLIYRKNKKILKNKKAAIELSESPMADFSDLPVELYFKQKDHNRFPLPYLISTGCLNRCCYCSIWPGCSSVTTKPPQKVVTELQDLIEKYKVNRIDLVADSLTGQAKYLEELCDAILVNKLKIRWGTQISLNETRPGLFKKMKAAGCELVQIGIESGSQALLIKMKKMIQIDAVPKVLKEIHKQGIISRCNFIAGMPFETREDFEATCDFVRKNASLMDVVVVDSFKLYKACIIFYNPTRFNIAQVKTETDKVLKYRPYCEHMENGQQSFASTRKFISIKTKLLQTIAKESGAEVIGSV
ncbi:MAG: radical SAM protein [Candidatus Omnitrophica bacterium]|nr:radical SAM protein [Candidatus Omnitrophota bacterium]